MESRCSNDPKTGAPREKMRQIQMISVGMSLDAVLNSRQIDAMQLRRCHDIWAEVNQEIVVHKRSGPFPEASSTFGTGSVTVPTIAECLGKGIRG